MGAHPSLLGHSLAFSHVGGTLMGSLRKNADIFSPDKIQVGSLENILLNNFTKNSKEGFLKVHIFFPSKIKKA